ncbi:MAG TPA: phosphatidylglycerol lysyltransferase domain-containing protein [Gaiellaceae bacterium]|jgi:lysyl-tRNA synthetase class 2|nr:phosphatidylglycerol lysyltransferase domain-containing protein [Gaiellaceae bacterium]
MTRVLRNAVAALAGLAVLFAAAGWLYLIRPDVGSAGPPIPDALPLDELSHRAAVPLALFLAVWGAAALLLGLLARAARLERLTAALLLGLGTGAFEYLVAGVSIAIVRQIPTHDAFRAAAEGRAVYLPAVLAGLGGALIGRRRSTARPRAPLLLAWGVAIAGGLGLVDALLPSHERSALAFLAPDRVRPVTSALVGPLALALLLAARGLARRRRRAWQVSLVLLGGSTVLHLLHGFNAGAAATALLTLGLVARRHDFDAPGDPTSPPRLALRALLLGGGIFLYAAAALLANQMAADQPFSLGFAARETGAALLGLRLHGSAHLGDDFGDWFPLSIFLAGLASAGWLLLGWIGPWRYRLRQEARERALARDLVAAWGADTLAPFVLRADKSYFFSESERAFLAYRVVGGVAIVSGDPVGPRGEYGELLDRFIGFARERGWRLAILGASEHRLELYRERGLHALYHGDEAVIETESFSLEGRPIRKVRQSVHRLERSGYRAEVLRPGDMDTELRRELESIAREWRGAEPERGFVMALDALFRLGDEDALFVVGRGPDGAAGFLHFAVCRAGAALSLSSMPRLRTTPNGFNEWLVCETVAWARSHGFARISLNFAPFAALLAPEAELSRLERVERRALLRLKGRFQLDNLLLFNRKFFPCWQRRFVVYERRLDLPRVGIAALSAEAYLPFAGRGRR